MDETESEEYRRLLECFCGDRMLTDYWFAKYRESESG